MRRSIAVLVLAAAAALPATARGDGLPVVGVEAGGSGTTTAAERFVAVPARGGTMVARIRRAGGQVLRTRLVKGGYSVPAVALDGSAAGVSANGRRLVLIGPRSGFPRAATPLLVLDARGLRVRAHVRLRGDFSFDAISPDGATMFLVHYLSRTDPTRYEVRAFDLRRMRLRAGAIVDPYEPGEAMRGLPLTRTTSRDGRWAYTFYDGASAHPFVHALDTVSGRARCIDLDALAHHPRLFELRLDLTGGELAVLDKAKPVARIDTTTFRVRGPAKAAAGTTPKDRGLGAPVPAVIALGLLALAALARVATRRRRPIGRHTMSHDYEQFMTTVQQGANISREEAERAAQATLQTLGERIARGEARDVAAQLPPEVGPWLATDGDAEGFDLDEFIRRVSDRADLPLERALKDARAVLLAVRRTITPQELADLMAELPSDLRALVEGADLPPSAELIVSSVAQRTGLDPADAQRAIAAVLETLAERIAGGEVDDLMRQLPPDLHPPLRTGKELSGGRATRMRLEQFLERVSEREGVTTEEARDHARAVFTTLRGLISTEEFLDITAQLPEEYAAVGAQP